MKPKRKKSKKPKIPKEFWTREQALKYLTTRIVDKFDAWMRGQTGPVMVIKNKPEFGYYEWDVVRFADALLENKPTYFD